jgi:hypothetical protein
MTEDRRADEGRERAEQVLRAMSEAGLTLKVKRHLADDGAQLLMVFVTAGAARLQKQSQRLRVERWLQEEGVGDMSRYGSELMLEGKSARQPHRKVVRVGGLHYFAPTQPMGGDSGATGANGGGGAGGALAGEGEAGALAGLACTSVDVRGGVGSGGVDGFGGGGGAAPGAAPLQLPASPGGSVYSGPTAAQHGNTAGEGALAAGHPNRFSTNAEFSPGPGFGAESALGTPPVAGSGAAGCSLPGVGVDGASANPAATFGAPAAFGAPSPRDAMPNGDVAPSSPVHEPGAPSLEEAAPLSAAARVELVHHILITPPARGGAGMAARMKADARRATILHMLPVSALLSLQPLALQATPYPTLLPAPRLPLMTPAPPPPRQLHDPLFNASLYRHANQLNPWALAARDAFISDVRAHFGEKVPLRLRGRGRGKRCLLGLEIGVEKKVPSGQAQAQSEGRGRKGGGGGFRLRLGSGGRRRGRGGIRFLLRLSGRGRGRAVWCPFLDGGRIFLLVGQGPPILVLVAHATSGGLLPAPPMP